MRVAEIFKGFQLWIFSDFIRWVPWETVRCHFHYILNIKLILQTFVSWVGRFSWIDKKYKSVSGLVLLKLQCCEFHLHTYPQSRRHEIRRRGVDRKESHRRPPASPYDSDTFRSHIRRARCSLMAGIVAYEHRERWRLLGYSATCCPICWEGEIRSERWRKKKKTLTIYKNSQKQNTPGCHDTEQQPFMCYIRDVVAHQWSEG